jgi:pSer/pThr/pTyr-binding forkhead associated (FHA) protein
MPKIVQYHGVKPMREYALTSGTFTIGRHPDNHIVINDLKVSSNHARIAIKPSAYMDDSMDYTLEDVGSTNGTFINGRRIDKPYLLKHHDSIQLGEYKLQFVDEQSIGHESTRILLKEK